MDFTHLYDMRGTTNRYGNIHMPSAGPIGDPSEDPKPSIVDARIQLLVEHRVPIPPRGTEQTEALYKFIDGEPLLRKDCLGLSQWLEAKYPRQHGYADLLAAMQRAEPSFVPILNLTRDDQSSEHFVDLLLEIDLSDLTCGVSAGARLSERVAHSLYRMMSSRDEPGHSRVTSFDYSFEEYQPPSVRDFLRESVTHCTTLERVSGSPSVLALLPQRSVPEIELEAIRTPSPAIRADLLAFLLPGNVEKISLKSDIEAAHRWFVEAVATANAQLPPGRAVHQVSLSTYTKRLAGLAPEEVVAQLFSTPHLSEITLPNPSWVLIPDLRERLNSFCVSTEQGLEKPLQSLQSLTFHHEEHHRELSPEETASLDDMIASLDSIIERNWERWRLETTGAAEAWVSNITMQLFKDNTHAHLKGMAGKPIDGLAVRLGKTFVQTYEGRALATVNKSTAAGAAKGREQAGDSAPTFAGSD